MEEQTVEQTGSYNIGNIILVESNFTRKASIEFTKEIDNKIDLLTEISPDNDSKIVVSLILSVDSVQDNEQVFSVKIKMTGVFTKTGIPKLPEDVFKKINAPAIIYPFIREHVATICLKAALGNIFIPPVNFVERNQ